MKKRAFSVLLGIVLLLQACTLPGATATPTPVAVDMPTVGPPIELYVEMDGDDANDCLTTSTPCATVWGALGKAAGPAEVNIGPGTFQTTGIAFTPGFDTVFRGAGMDATLLETDRTTSIFIISSAIDVRIESLTIGRAREGAPDTWGLRVQGSSARVTTMCA